MQYYYRTEEVSVVTFEKVTEQLNEATDKMKHTFAEVRRCERTGRS